MSRRSIVIAGVLVVALVGSLLLRSRASSSGERAPGAAQVEQSAAPAPSVPVGPDPRDAVVAAEDVIRLTGEIATAGFITRGDLIRSIATDEFGNELAAVSSGQLAEMTETLGAASVAPADLVWVEYPLASCLVRASGTEAVVDVWSVLVVGVPDVGAPRQVWRTVTMTMRWERDAWLVDGWSVTAGPTPALAATSAVSSVADVEVVAGWDLAGIGGGR